MTRSAKTIVLTSVALAALAAGGGLALRDAGQEESPAGDAGASREPPVVEKIETRDREPREGELSIVDRFNAPDAGLTVPADFHSVWAPSLSECRGRGWVSVEPGGFRAPDFLAALVEPARIVRETTPGGEAAATIVARVERMDEGEMGTGRIRMSRVGEHLYMSNADAVGEAEHWQHRNVRCPDPRSE
jgi:hypothetical protein